MNPNNTGNELQLKRLQAVLKEAKAELKEAKAELTEARAFYLVDGGESVLPRTAAPMDVDNRHVPAFDPATYKLDFPFFASSESDEHVSFTSRGMGKPFLLKCVGSQRLRAGLQCPDLVEAATLGRVLSFDFSAHPIEITTVFEADSILKQLMVFFLCHMFDGYEVDGIRFQSQDFPPVFARLQAANLSSRIG
ncbi:hypothetical protein HDU81_009239 [Chytriomyces hyalinus]|nr:hypothetical protein HDU81_009239 [Chytriomyces hyalinus]